MALGHAWLSVLPVVIGLAIAVPLGWLANRYRWTYPPIMSFFGVIYTIPSLAVFVAMPGLLHTQILDPDQRCRGAALYTVALLVRVVADALAAVPFEVQQSATAMGFRGFQRFVRVELPLAIPVITAGLRVAVVANVSLVAIAAFLGVARARPAVHHRHPAAVLPADHSRHHSLRAARGRPRRLLVVGLALGDAVAAGGESLMFFTKSGTFSRPRRTGTGRPDPATHARHLQYSGIALAWRC